MKCTSCDLYHPAQYDKCVSCGGPLTAKNDSSPDPGKESGQDTGYDSDYDSVNEYSHEPENMPAQKMAAKRAEANTRANTNTVSPSASDDVREKPRRSKTPHHGVKSKTPMVVSIFAAFLILLICAGATVFLLTKKPDDERLFSQAQKELANGQYAFAVATLNKAIHLKPNNPRLYLALARAYVGIDQVDKAWDSIGKAKQLGVGVAVEPNLSSELANYYRQRSQYEKAIDLLRPLSQLGIPGKKAELADLDALWGDEALRNGKPELALRCWEEVRDLHEGSRFVEADARLSTIYGKLASVAAAKKDDEEALKYIGKLNVIAQNAKNYCLAADIYEREGKIDLAIEQIRLATKAAGHDAALDHRLVDLLSRRGKELLDQGNTDTGYAYLQQAKQLDPKGVMPLITVKGLTATIDGGTHLPHLTGAVWNPTDTNIDNLTIKAEVFDTTKSETVWSKENHIVDEFVPPLAPHQSRNFEFIADQPVKSGDAEFHVYLDGKLYKSYPLGKKDPKDEIPLAAQKALPAPTNEAPSLPRIQPPPESNTPVVAPAIGAGSSGRGTSAEEKTMKDLEF
jgi:tetratricopeptide (TPR) repeat protein